MLKYEINDETIALIPVNPTTTRIIELSNEFIIPQPAFSIMEENCEYYGSTYTGRINAAKKILNISYKIPLLVEETNKMIFFPTKSSTSEDCCWINYNMVEKRKKTGKNIKVKFKNGKEEEFDLSKTSFENQLLRSGMLDALLTNRTIKK